MASNGSLASYFISLGIKVDKSELKKIDTLLKDIEKRLKGIGKAQDETNRPKGKRPLSEEQQRLKVAKEAAKVAEHQAKLRNGWLKQQDKIADSAKKVHDFQMKLMRQAQGAANAGAKQDVKNVQAVARAVGKNSTAWKQQFKSTMSGMVGKPTSGRLLNERQKMYDSLFGATSKGQPFKSLSASQIRANQKSFFANTRGIEVRSGYNSQYRLGEQQAASAAKGAAERVAAEKEANKKIEQERKTHNQKIEREETARLIRQRAIDKLYGRAQVQSQIMQQAQQNWLERQRIRQEQMEARGSRSAASYSRANFLHAGGAGGAIARYGAGALPFVGGVYGLASLNTVNQQLQANDLAIDAVAGSKSGEYKKYLNDLGNRLGMTTRELQPSFTQYLANAQGTALEGTLQRDFTSFTQYGAVMGLGPEEMKGSLKAITQMVSKQQIYAEELRGQLAERMPAAVRIMADAVTGGDTKKLIEMMGKGQLDPNTVLPKFFEEMRARSESSLTKYFEGSRFAQGRMSKSFEDLIKLFSKSGGESAFAKMFNSIADGAKESEPLVRGLTGAFENMVRFMDAPIDLFKDFNRVLEETSRISGVSEKSLTSLALVGAAMATKWGRVAGMFGLIFITLQDLSYGLQGYDSYTKRAMDLFDFKSPQTLRDETKVDLNVPAMGYPKGYNSDSWDKRMDTIEDPRSIYYKDPEGYDAFRQDSLNALRDNKAYEQSVSFGDINITMPEGSAEMSSEEKANSFADFLQQKLTETMSSFGTK